MSTPLTPDQIQKLKDLGIPVPNDTPIVPPTPTPTPTPPPSPEPIPTPTPSPVSIPTPTPEPKTASPSVVPLLSISGLSLLSVGGLLLFKSKSDSVSVVIPNTKYQIPDTQVNPTQVPKSIQHYLLTSQQYYSQALQVQQAKTDQAQVAELLNQSLLAATSAIKEFPSDYRGYEQRGRIYQSLIDSKPELAATALQDFQKASQLNPSSADLTHTIALLFAKKGDLNQTLNYLSKTIILEPTKAQNFYDLALLQQQAGLLPDAINTYDQLLTIVPDTTQKQQIQTQLATLQELVKNNKSGRLPASTGNKDLTPTVTLTDPDAKLLQASGENNLIIAAPATDKSISVTGQTTSNAFSGTASLETNQTSFTLTNTNITPTAMVYVTLTQGGKNEILKVLSKADGSCTIGFDYPVNEPVEFKWWIIN